MAEGALELLDLLVHTSLVPVQVRLADERLVAVVQGAKMRLQAVGVMGALVGVVIPDSGKELATNFTTEVGLIRASELPLSAWLSWVVASVRI